MSTKVYDRLLKIDSQGTTSTCIASLIFCNFFFQHSDTHQPLSGMEPPNRKTNPCFWGLKRVELLSFIIIVIDNN